MLFYPAVICVEFGHFMHITGKMYCTKSNSDKKKIKKKHLFINCLNAS